MRTLIVGAWLTLTASSVVGQSRPIPDRTERVAPPRNQLSLTGGSLLDFSLSYARRIAESRMALGVTLGAAWEMNNHTLDRNVWNVGHLEILGRYHPNQSVTLEGGPTFMVYNWTDDCAACSGSFVGLRAAILVGYRFVYLGYAARLGTASDDRNGTAFGVIHTPELRLVIGW